MSDVRPFRALRPAAGFEEKVAVLPYDVMSADEAREMVKGNPYSFLHVTRSEIDLDPATDHYDGAVYKKAAENLKKLEQDGILINEEKPCYYIYSQTMDGRTQTGIAACASVDEYHDGRIKKHELTREEKEQDRIKHVETCDANTGPVFLTYKPVPELDFIIRKWKWQHEADYDFTASDGVRHTVWVVSDDEVIGAIRDSFKTIDALYIADGHHRNASTAKVALGKRAKNPGYDKNAEFNYYLAVIFSSDQLSIMDYNRVVKTLNGNDNDSFLKSVRNEFMVTEHPAGIYRPESRHTFGMYLGGKWYKLSAKPEIVNDSDPVASLDVSILQTHLLSPILGIKDPRTDANIDFVGGLRGLGALQEAVDSGTAKVAFAMYPTSMDELISIADSGQIMPPKSTWFEPKLRSGLFVHKLS